MWGAQLILIESDERYRVELQMLDETRQLAQVVGKCYRTSPIFPAARQADLVDVKRYKHLTFFTCQSGFQALAQLKNALTPNLLEGLFFSIGLPSILLFYNDSADFVIALSALDPVPVAHETWDLDDGNIIHQDVSIRAAVSFHAAEFALRSTCTIKDFDLRQLLEEIQHSISELAAQSALYGPEKLATLRNLVGHINRIIISVEQCLDGLGAGASIESRCSVQKRLNTQVDYLIQINSSLAYVVSQAYSGATPILKRRCLYHTHSLLGIGTALKALDAFGCAIADAFTAVPVFEAIRSLGPQSKSFYPGRSSYDFSEVLLRDPVLAIDDISGSVIRQPQKPHLFFFSGRLGFQESLFAVSAAMQTLAAADTVRWSLMTLSHELMHAHVREVLAAVFSSDAVPENDERFSAFYSTYREFVTNATFNDYSFIDSLRFTVFNYCAVRHCVEASLATSFAATGHLRVDETLPSRETLYHLLRQYYRDINEIIVHVLDFHYVYNGHAELYLDYLWVSWSTVPSVLANLEHYILRSVCAISTTYKTAVNQRSQYAIRDINATIKRLCETYPENTLLQYANQYLRVYPKTPAARHVIQAQAKWSRAK